MQVVNLPNNVRPFDLINAVHNSNYFAIANSLFRRSDDGRSFDFNQSGEHWPQSNLFFGSSVRHEIQKACFFRDVVESVALSSGNYDYAFFSDTEAAREVSINGSDFFSLVSPRLLRIENKNRLDFPDDAAFCLFETWGKKGLQNDLEAEIAANGEFWWATNPDLSEVCSRIGVCSLFATYDDHSIRTKVFQKI